jgi:hypothetical protein
MDEGIKFFVGLDVHKDSIAVAVAEAGRAPARLIGSIAHDVGKLRKLLARYGEPGAVQVVYEAGPTGYGLQRELARRGYQCQVIAPSLIPKRAGDRIKTDHRDGLRLAELARAGEFPRLAQFSIAISAQPRGQNSSAVHDAVPVFLRPLVTSSADGGSAAMRRNLSRARERRDITVPIGIASAAAISS